MVIEGVTLLLIDTDIGTIKLWARIEKRYHSDRINWSVIWCSNIGRKDTLVKIKKIQCNNIKIFFLWVKFDDVVKKCEFNITKIIIRYAYCVVSIYKLINIDNLYCKQVCFYLILKKNIFFKKLLFFLTFVIMLYLIYIYLL